jgi:hypothetical protein
MVVGSAPFGPVPAADGRLMPQTAPANGEGGNGLQRRGGLAR